MVPTQKKEEENQAVWGEKKRGGRRKQSSPKRTVREKERWPFQQAHKGVKDGKEDSTIE